jgi:DNA polymerase kappa
LDAFYAAVEMKSNPELKEKPLAIGDKNMIMTTNYVARGFGIRSGVPGFIGMKLCPQLIIVKPDFSKYRAISAKFHEVLKRFDPDIEVVGLDEANLDVTKYLEE